jgi:hypothetical protein
MKKLHLRLVGIAEHSQLQSSENIFNRTIQKNFPNLKKDTTIKVQEADRTQNRLGKRRKSSYHIIIKTLNI